MITDSNKRRPFLFDVDFGAAEIQTDDIPKVEEEPTPPTFSEAEFQAAEQGAYVGAVSDKGQKLPKSWPSVYFRYHGRFCCKIPNRAAAKLH